MRAVPCPTLVPWRIFRRPLKVQNPGDQFRPLRSGSGGLNGTPDPNGPTNHGLSGWWLNQPTWKILVKFNTHSTSPAEFTHPQWRELPLSCRFGSKQRYSKASGECAEAFFYIDSQKDMQRWEKSEPSVTGESTQIEHKYEGGTPQRGLQEFAHSRLPSETLILAIVTSKVHVRNDTDEPTIWSTHVSENAIWHHICEHKKLVRKTTLDKSHSLLKASSPHFKATSVQRRSLFPASE